VGRAVRGRADALGGEGCDGAVDVNHAALRRLLDPLCARLRLLRTLDRVHVLALVTVGEASRLSVASPDYKEWSLYGAPWLQPVASAGKRGGAVIGPNTRKPLPWVATGCGKERMVRRGSIASPAGDVNAS
jgi:hypothetical protein